MSTTLSPTRENDPSFFDEVYDWVLLEIDRRWSTGFFDSLLSERLLAMANDVELRTLQVQKSKHSLGHVGAQRPLLSRKQSHGASLVMFNGGVDSLFHDEEGQYRSARPSMDMTGL